VREKIVLENYRSKKQKKKKDKEWIFPEKRLETWCKVNKKRETITLPKIRWEKKPTNFLKSLSAFDYSSRWF
jgi:hypothetical protein